MGLPHEGMNEKKGIAKYSSGIAGFDTVTYGGLPEGKTTMISGGPGSGKTILGMGCIVSGITKYDEPGVYMSFEETPEDLQANAASFGWDVEAMRAGKKLFLDCVVFDPDEYQVAGDFDLEGLLIRIEHNLQSVGAQRLVLDGIDTLLSAFEDPHLHRMEMKRLVRWLRKREISTIITSERQSTEAGVARMEEYVVDCVIHLDTRLIDENMTRRLRVVKYRGSQHGINEYPFLIGKEGITIFPLSALELDHGASQERISSGIVGLDRMLKGGGYYRGTTILITGSAGTGKSSLAAHFVDAACARGERALYMSFEESPRQLERNMASIGINLGQWREKELLRFYNVRSTYQGLEPHFVTIYEMIGEFKPQVVVMDPLSSMETSGTYYQIKSFLTRVIDHIKKQGITFLTTKLLERNDLAKAEEGVSSIMDTWIRVDQVRKENRFERVIYLVKSRGMQHSQRIHQFHITDQGVQIDVQGKAGEGD